jgi:hypothetical protein
VPDHRSTDGGPTLGEIGRRLDNLSGQVRDLKSDLNATYVRRDVYDADRRGDAVEMRGALVRIEAIEQAKKWGSRTVITAVLAVAGTLIATVLAVRFGIQ